MFHYQVISLFRLLPDVLNVSLKRNKTILFACGDGRERKVCREENEMSFRPGGGAEALMKEQNHSLLGFFLGCFTCLLQRGWQEILPHKMECLSSSEIRQPPPVFTANRGEAPCLWVRGCHKGLPGFITFTEGEEPSRKLWRWRLEVKSRAPAVVSRVSF